METAADTKSIAYPLESPELRRKPKLSCGDGYTTPRSIKTLKRLQKLQDAPSLTNSLDFTGTNDCTPKQQKKCRGRDCTPEMPEKEDHKLVPDKEPQQESLQSAFTTLLNQSDSIGRSRPDATSATECIRPSSSWSDSISSPSTRGARPCSSSS